MIPLPSDYRTLQRRLAELADDINQAAAARIPSVSTGHLTIADTGAVDVTRGGVVRVHDGGRLVLDREAADRLLAPARVVPFAQPASPLPVGTDWTDAITYKIPTPEWASQVTVHAAGGFTFHANSGPDLATVTARVTIGDQHGLDTPAVASTDGTRLTWQGAHTASLPVLVDKPLTVTLQVAATTVASVSTAGSTGLLHGLITYREA